MVQDWLWATTSTHVAEAAEKSDPAIEHGLGPACAGESHR